MIFYHLKKDRFIGEVDMEEDFNSTQKISSAWKFVVTET